MAKKTSLRRGIPPEKPSRVTDEDLFGWWKRFIDGEQPFMIAETEGKELKSVEKGLIYIAYKIGRPDVGIERCRLIEHHHKMMVQLNESIESSRKHVARIDAELDEQMDFDADSKDKLRAARTRELSVQTKLYIEARNVATALEALFQMKSVSLPVDEEDAGQERGALDHLTHEQLVKLLGPEEAVDAEEIAFEDENP